MLGAVALPLCLLPAAATGADAPTPKVSYHVATQGNDAWSGTLAEPNAGKTDGPFASLERARDEVRKLKQGAGLPAGGVAIRIGVGIHRRQQTFVLEAQDSGTAEAPVVYRGVPGAQTRLLGGMVLPAAAFAPITDPAVLARLDPTARGQVRQVSLRQCGVPEPGPEWATRFAGGAASPELFFAGQRMTLARWPNEGWARVVDVVGGAPHRIQGVPGDKIGVFTYAGDRPQRWLAEPDLWLHGYWFWDWSDGRQKVEAIDPARKTINLAPPYHHYGYRKNARYYAMNALCELDSPGEWTIDRDSWTLFFWPPAALAESEASLSLLTEPLATLSEVSQVTFRDLVFEVSRGEGVQIRGGTADLVAGCTFRNLARLAVRVEGGTKHGVQSCDLYNLGVGGISLTGGDRATLTPGGHYADNNHIHHFAQLVYAYQNAIRLNGVGGRMSHNLIHDTIHEALAYSGNDHVVEFNEVYNVCLEADDSGVIHQGRDWTWRGNIIRYNFFHDILGGSAVSNMGVYLDDMECGVEVFGNVLYRIPRAILAGGGRDNLIRNNLIIDCPISIHVDNRAMNWASYHVGTTMKGLLNRVPYQTEPWKSRYPKLAGIWEDEPAAPKGNVVQHNLMVRSGEMSLAPEVPKFGTVADNLFLKADPGFVNPEALDFRLKDPAAVQRQLPGFKDIPFAQIGLRTDAYRLGLPVGNPVINPDSRAFVDELEIRLQPGRGAADVEIRYTLDGSEPTAASTLYRGPFKLKEDGTLKAVAFATAGGERSGVSAATYTVSHLGPRAGVFLSGLPAVEAVAHGGIKLNRNYAGDGPVSLAGRTYEQSLILCPEAAPTGGRGRVTYDLSGGLERATTLKATIGVDDAVKPNGTVVFIVEVERKGAWEKVFESGILRGGEAKDIAVPIAGATRLRLVTTDAGDNIHSDHAVWAKPLLQ
jgi:hypothetical protein